MQKPSCKNTPQYLTSCCSPIGQNNTKDFSAQSGGSIGKAVWKWSGKSRFLGAFFALFVNIRRFISLPDLFPLAPTNGPWVSEDDCYLKTKSIELRGQPVPSEKVFHCKLRIGDQFLCAQWGTTCNMERQCSIVVRQVEIKHCPYYVALEH